MSIIQPRAIQDACPLHTPSGPHLQLGAGTAIKITARANALFPAHSSITATTVAPYRAPGTASAPAQAQSPAPVQVLALVQGTVRSPGQYHVFAQVRVGARELAVALALYL